MTRPCPGGSAGFSAPFFDGMRFEIEPVNGASPLNGFPGELDAGKYGFARPLLLFVCQGFLLAPEITLASFRLRTVSISNEGIST